MAAALLGLMLGMGPSAAAASAAATTPAGGALAAEFSVRTDRSGSVQVVFGGTEWMRSASEHLTVVSGGVRRTGQADLKLAAGGCRDSAGTDRLGGFRATRCDWRCIAEGCAGRLLVRTGVRSYHDGIISEPAGATAMAVIELGFPGGVAATGANNSVSAANTGQVSSWPSISPPPTSAERLGWFTWHGGKVQSCSDADESEWRCLPNGEWTAAGGQQQLLFPTLKWGASGGGGGGDPFVLFNDGNATAGEQRAMVVGTASDDSMASSHTLSPDGQGRVNAGLLGSIQSIPAGHIHETLIVASADGVNAAVSAFGGALLQRYNKTRARPPDFTADHLSYYTDNGAFLYYRFPYPPGDPQFNGTGYSDELLGLVATGQREHIPFRALQFDSWWYDKAANGGTIRWGPTLMGGSVGTAAFHEQTGRLPVVSHNRFWAAGAARTYSGYPWAVDNQTEQEGGLDACAMPLSTAFWRDLFSNASRTWGLHTYLQDYIDVEWLCTRQARGTVHGARTWLRQMGSGAAAAGVSIQYCGAFLQHLLQSVEIEAVRQIRVSEDYEPTRGGLRSNQWSIGTSSMLAEAVGLASFKDVFWSSSDTVPAAVSKYGWQGEVAPELQAAVATLSTGPVAVGDPPAVLNHTLLLRTCTAAGQILKPSAAATTVDAVRPSFC